MKRKAFMFILSLIAVFSVTVGVQGQSVSASEGQQAIDLYQNSKPVTVEGIEFSVTPPRVHFYSSGGWAGYLLLVSYYYSASKDRYYATYTGTLYDGPPYPAPYSIIIEDEK